MTSTPTVGVLDHPLWNEIRPYVSLERCRDARGETARYRLELKGLRPPLSDKALAAVVHCPYCKGPYNPVRARKGKEPIKRSSLQRHFYLAVTCPLDVNKGCSRSKAATLAQEAVIADVISYWEGAGDGVIHIDADALERGQRCIVFGWTFKKAKKTYTATSPTGKELVASTIEELAKLVEQEEKNR